MVTCVLCNFTVEMDDAAVTLASRPRCICLRCFAREVGAPPPPLPTWLRREVEAALHVDV